MRPRVGTLVIAKFLIMGMMMLAAPTAWVSSVGFSMSAATPAAHPFTEYLLDEGIIGTNDHALTDSGQSISRGELAQLLVQAAGIKESFAPGQPTFQDVPSDHGLFETIETAAAASLLSGFPDDLFRPDSSMTRAELAIAVLRLSNAPAPPVNLPQQVTDLDTRHWAAPAIAVALDAGVLSLRDGRRAAPDLPATWHEAARALAIMSMLNPNRLPVTLTGVLVPVRGDVAITRDGERVTVTKPLPVAAGDRIRTGLNSQARIDFPDGSGFLLASITEVIMGEAHGRRILLGNGIPELQIERLDLRLLRGRLIGSLNDARPEAADTYGLASDEHPWWKMLWTPGTRVRINMPWGVAGIRGTIWSNAVGVSGQTTSVIEGEVEVTAAGQSVQVTAGNAAAITAPGGRPSLPTRMSGQESTIWQRHSDWVGERRQDAMEFRPVDPRGLNRSDDDSESPASESPGRQQHQLPGAPKSAPPGQDVSNSSWEGSANLADGLFGPADTQMSGQGKGQGPGQKP
ncbi:MAG: S-layer homology domain-containing protein [Thermaerobacterales bacterium]